jgi:hypothetical protein
LLGGVVAAVSEDLRFASIAFTATAAAIMLYGFGNTYLAEQVSLGRERQNVTDFNEMI